MGDVERVQIEGLVFRLPKYWEGQLAIYFCKYCQETPEINPGEIAMPIEHDECVAISVRTILDQNTDLVRQTEEKLRALKNTH